MTSGFALDVCVSKPRLKNLGLNSLVATAVLALLAAAPTIRGVELALAGWAVAFAALATARSCADAEIKSLGAFAVCWLAGHTLLGVSTWPVPMLLSLAGFVLVLAARREYRGVLARLRAGRCTPVAVTGTLGIAILTVALLSLTELSAERATPGVATHGRLTGAQFWVVCLTFAVVNAAIEEFVWRFVGWEAARRIVVPATGVVLLSALSFGIAHLHGVPPGWSGAVLATAFGVALGHVRYVSGGLLLPWLVHVVADVTIFVRLG